MSHFCIFVKFKSHKPNILSQGLAYESSLEWKDTDIISSGIFCVLVKQRGKKKICIFVIWCDGFISTIILGKIRLETEFDAFLV